jgi:hypothetical protein
MPLSSIAPAEDWGSASNIGSTFGWKVIDPAKAAGEQVHWASKKEAFNGPAAETPHTWNGEAKPLVTELMQTRPSVVRVLGWPKVIEERPRTTTFYARQEWEGYVVAIDETEFTARLVDLTTGSSYEEEEAEIPLEEVSETDAQKMQIGSIFRWAIGIRRSATGQKERVSRIVFRDLPAMSRRDE